MLTDSEKKWLEEREKEKLYNGYYFCAYSEIRSAEWNTKTGWGDVYWVIETKDAYKDAAEFEARVAVMIAERALFVPCEVNGLCGPKILSCAECYLKHARLAVEEEMDECTDCL